jgi:hypothetical protein
MKQTIWALERNETNTLSYIKLKHVASVIEGCIPIGRPEQVLGRSHFAKLRTRHSQKRLAVGAVSISCLAHGVGDLAGIGFQGKRAGMGASICYSPFDFIERVRQHGGILFVNAVTKTTDMEHKKAKST